MKNSDRQHLTLLLSKIDSFNKSKLLLNSLIDDFEAVINILSDDCEGLRKTLRGFWWDLEQVLAHALYYDSEKLNEKEVEIIRKAIARTKSEIENALSNYLKTSDSSISKTVQEVNSRWLMCPECIDAWESSSTNAMVICPKCDQTFHNPRYREGRK